MSTEPTKINGRVEEGKPRFDGLSAAKKALLELRMKKGQRAPRDSAIPRREKQNFVPVSYAQELLWLLDQLNPNTSVYGVPRAMRIKGPLQIDVLERVLDTIVNRHEVLRTTFTFQGEHPVQVIAPPSKFHLRQVDLSSVPIGEQDDEIQRLLTEEALHPFDLSRDLMFRGLLLKLSPDENVLYLGTHHIASDGWSKSVLFKELRELYRAYCAGQASPLPELPIQYADFAIWQRKELDSSSLEGQLEYWKKQLAEAPTLLEIPSDRPRPAIQTFRGSFVRVVFPKALLDGLKAVGQREGATLFMTLLAAFDAFICRYTGQDDLVFGTPIAGRNRPEMEGLIGYFTNTLALRSDVSGNPTFQELLARVRQMVLGAFDHQDLPFEKLVVELKPTRNLSHSPVFQVLFSVGHVGASVPDLPGLQTTPILINRGITKFDLTVGLTELDDGLAVVFDYSSDLFDQATIHRMLDSFRVLLEGIVADPECRVSDLPLMTLAQRSRLLIGWNETQSERPHGRCIHDLISDQTSRDPDAVAVVAGVHQLTYRDLDSRANQLAHFLKSRGVGPEVLVGICVERSIDMAVAMMGILKAGGAFLPLDPAYPKDRIDYMIRDAKVELILTQQSLRNQCARENVVTWCLDTDWPTMGAKNSASPLHAAKPQSPAYVIYTSGSTGQPRGVVVTHEGLINHNLSVVKAYGLDQNDRVLQFAPLSFDIAIEEIFPTWVAGGAIVLRQDDMPLGGPPFVQWLRQNNITVLNLPTAFWHEWVQDLSSTRESLPEPLRLVIVGGEKAKANLYGEWLKIAQDRVRWINTYGPTETTVIVTLHEPASSANKKAPDGELPIGRPIANTQAFILDRSLQPVPIGVPGELYIAGQGLARGYLHQPRLTAEKFVPNPFSRTQGERLYRTGDRVRYRPNGNIEFLGRVDEQVKVRGFRIEPGEIEAALCQHDNVQEAVVIVREDQPGDRRLVGYVVPRGESPSARSLQSHLRDRLPEYMIPSIFVNVPTIAKTPSGKVDRRSLPSPEFTQDATDTAFIAPRNLVEVQMAMLWEGLLGVHRVSMRDNFFELGGHSLLAVRLLSQISTLFGKNLPLASLFHAPTVEQLAELIQPDQESFSWDPVIPIRPQGTRPPFFCAAAPNVNALGFVFLARHLGPDQPLYGLQSQHGGKRRQIYSREEYHAIASDYIAAMRRIQPHGPYYLGGTCEGSHIAFEMARQLIEANEEVGLLAMLDAWPLENSTSYFRVNYVQYNYRRIRSLLNHGVRAFGKIIGKTKKGLARLMTEKTKHLNTKKQFDRKAPQPAMAQLLPAENWRERLWPGKKFVPPAIPVHITVFRVRKQPYWRIRDEKLCWGPWSSVGVQVYVIPGRHNTILREPYVRVAAELLDECLIRAQNSGRRT